MTAHKTKMFMTFPFAFCGCNKRHNQKQFGEERVCFHLQVRFMSVMKETRAGSQGGNWEAGTEAETKEFCLLDYSS